MLLLDGEKTILCNLCTFFLMRQIIFRLGKQIILTDVAVKIFPNGKKILKFRLVIGEAEPPQGQVYQKCEAAMPTRMDFAVMFRLILLLEKTRGISVSVFTRPLFWTGRPVESLPVYSVTG